MQPQIRDVCDESFMRTFSSSSTKPHTPHPFRTGTRTHTTTCTCFCSMSPWRDWGVGSGGGSDGYSNSPEKKKK